MKRAFIFIALVIVFSFSVRADTFLITWKPNAPVDSVLFYHVYGITGVDTALIATVPAPGTSWVTGQVERGDLHRHVLKAQNRFGYSPFSNEVSGVFLTPELDYLCYITALEVSESGEAILKWHSEEPSVGGFQYKVAGAEDWVIALDPGFFLLPPVQDHEQRIPIDRGHLWTFRAFCYPGAEKHVIVSLADTLDMTGTVPGPPEVEIRPF